MPLFLFLLTRRLVVSQFSPVIYFKSTLNVSLYSRLHRVRRKRHLISGNMTFELTTTQEKSTFPSDAAWLETSRRTWRNRDTDKLWYPHDLLRSFQSAFFVNFIHRYIHTKSKPFLIRRSTMFYRFPILPSLFISIVVGRLEEALYLRRCLLLSLFTFVPISSEDTIPTAKCMWLIWDYF